MDIKICGLRNVAAIDAAIAGGTTHTGFIFFPKSPRHVADMGLARDLASAVDRRAKVVPVTVNADDAMLDDIVAAMAPDMLQLHGGESPDRVAEVKERYQMPVMKAFAIRDEADFDKIGPYRGVADRFLFDAKAPPAGELPGGNGIAFDWSLLKALPEATDFMLSGGLSMENVASAIRDVRPSGIDLSSGVESSPGVKDVALIEAFLAHVNEVCAPTLADMPSVEL
ncbi:MAG: phosphoribosylanthranilate isomerase [Pseudomonadota bacterium]